MKLFKNLLFLSAGLLIFQICYHQVVADVFPKNIAHFLVAAQGAILGLYSILMVAYLAIALSVKKKPVKRRTTKQTEEPQATPTGAVQTAPETQPANVPLKKTA